jgi:hypothetical protein
VADLDTPDPTNPLYQTYGAWQRTLPPSADGLVQFSGRFVYEQTAPGGGGYDECYAKALQLGETPYDAATGVSGGGWYVNASGIWGSGFWMVGGTNLLHSDDIGFTFEATHWYQQNVDQCSVTAYQTMFIDAVNSPIAYNTGSPYGATSQLVVQIDNSPVDGLCTSVKPNGGTLVPACKDYP